MCTLYHVRRQFIGVHIPPSLIKLKQDGARKRSESTPIRIPPHTPYNHHTLLPLATACPSPNIHTAHHRRRADPTPTSTPLTPSTSSMLPRQTPRAKILPTAPTRRDFDAFRMETRLMVQRGEVGEVFGAEDVAAAAAVVAAG